MPEGATHWSKRELARRAGISPSSALRVWHAFGLQPWRTEAFKISPDLLLTDKIRDVVGLYLAPPANAAVFAVDEKPQIQALERTAPVLPMIPADCWPICSCGTRSGFTRHPARRRPWPGRSGARGWYSTTR